MRFGATLSLLCAAAAVAPAALAMPVSADSTDALEARAFDAEVADLVARSDFEGVTTLLARAVVDMLEARNDDPPHYHKHDPINGKKPKYSEKDPNPPPKYRQKDPHKPNREPKPKPGPSRPRDLAEVDDLWAREDLEEMWARDVEEVMAQNDDPPHYHKHDPVNGKKPKYSEKDPNPPPKYRQKDPHKPNREPKPKPGPSRPRDLSEVEELVARNDDPPHYHKHDPNNGKKPKYSEKDPNPPPKYRQKDPHKPNREPKPKPGPSRPRELSESDFWW